MIRGFKSFAERTIFDLTPGVAVVVGPNGSGKSNVVDAISWVLGEQGAKTLRGGSMQDVIFAGSPTKPAYGRAEVELTIDNSSGVLPIEFAEVTIRRTLFRSGESDYAINGAPCRLLDIQELLSDSGIGRELHTIVGQGHLVDVLAGRPVERRAIIEEAAGLLKYRKRKERAVRKLERVDADTERLGDVINELRRQIRPLERQAEIAKRAAEIETEAGELRLKLWTLEYRALDREGDAEAERRALEDVASLSERYAATMSGVEELERHVAEASRESGELVQAEYRLAGARDRLQALARLAQERAQHLRDLAAREPTEEAPSQHEIAESEAALETARAARREAEDGARRTETERSEAQEARAEARRAREEIVHLHGERAALRAAVENAQEERASLAERRRALAETLAANAAQIEEVRAELARLEERETAAGARFEAIDGKRAAGERVIATMASKEREAERAVEALALRMNVLTDAIEQDRDPAAVLDGARGILGRVLDQVRPAPGYERALRAALGPIAHALLASDRADAMAALDRMKGAGARAAIALPGASIYEPLPHGVRALSSVVASAGPRGEAVLALLAGVGVADSLAEAAEITAEHRRVVVVTIEGDRLGPNVLIGGAPEDAIDPREQLARIEAEHAEASAGLEGLRRDLGAVRAEVAVLAGELEPVGTELEEIDAETDGATQRLGAMENQRSVLEREDSVLSGRQTEVSERLAADTERLQAVEARLGRAVAAEPEVDELAIASIERRAAEHALRLGEATERERAAGAHLDGLRARARRVADERERWESGRDRWLTGATRASAVGDAARATAGRVETWVEQARAAREGGDDRRARLQEDLTAARATGRELDAALQEARERAHQADLRRAERSHRMTALVERLRDDHAMAPAEALEAVSCEPEEEDDLRRRLATLDRKLGLLGRVNPIAMEQFQELVDRHAFLTDQVADLRKSRRDLMDVVREVDAKIVEVFGAAFADVAREFSEVFSRLFPGGEGALTLTEPDNLLESGIEVEARPAGKRVKRVSLLSGGERSLVAVALLFAVFRARPSPFYVMDEVEAALDDINLQRFLTLAVEFRRSSQLLIVTHQKRTMEIADTLYGISMGREGVSKVICERLEEPAADAGSPPGEPLTLDDRVIELS